jgi:hypothetical protein
MDIISASLLFSIETLTKLLLLEFVTKSVLILILKPSKAFEALAHGFFEPQTYTPISR